MEFIDPLTWSLRTSILVFIVCAITIAVAGTFLAGNVDKLADRTGAGEAIAGAVFMGAATSLSGSVLSATAAYDGLAELALGNALGGIAVQTAFLAVADVTYRRANLEHAAASSANMMQAALLTCLMAILIIAPFTPNVVVWGVHPLTLALVCIYLYGMTLVRSARTAPMWRPEHTTETREDAPEAQSQTQSLVALWLYFAVLALIMGIAGWVLKDAASNITRQTDLGEAAVGVFFTSVSTSLPELVTSIAAVRRGALTLAVGGIIGGNAFDTLFAAFSDVAYRGGSIYHTMSDQLLFWIGLTILMTGALQMGLIRRERKGIGHIGFESCAILVLYLAGLGVMLSG